MKRNNISNDYELVDNDPEREKIKKSLAQISAILDSLAEDHGLGMVCVETAIFNQDCSDLIGKDVKGCAKYLANKVKPIVEKRRDEVAIWNATHGDVILSAYSNIPKLY